MSTLKAPSLTKKSRETEWEKKWHRACGYMGDSWKALPQPEKWSVYATKSSPALCSFPVIEPELHSWLKGLQLNWNPYIPQPKAERPESAQEDPDTAMKIFLDISQTFLLLFANSVAVCTYVFSHVLANKLVHLLPNVYTP